MADPVTTTLLVLGTAVSATSSIAQGVQASKTAKFNAKVNEVNAAATRQAAAENERRFRRTTQQRLGAIRAGRESEGSALDILEDNAIEEELQALSIRHQGELAAAGVETSAALDRRRADAALSGGFAKAGSALLLGGSKISAQRGAASTTTGTKLKSHGNSARSGISANA